jgi:hypothetical protein
VRRWAATPGRGFLLGLGCGLMIAALVSITVAAATDGGSAGAARTAASGPAGSPVTPFPGTTPTDSTVPTVEPTDAARRTDEGTLGSTDAQTSTDTSQDGSDDRADSGPTQTSGNASVTPVLTPPVVADRLPARRRVSCPTATTTVSSSDELAAALVKAAPGDVIALADGTYPGSFVATTSGTATAPIWLCGGRGAVLDGEGVRKGYVLHLNGVAYWRLVGFTVTNGQKGVVTDATAHTVVQGLDVHGVGDEAIHLRARSTGNAILDNVISRTGLRRDKFGEGVYVGSSVNNWGQYSAGQPDRSDYNLVLGNRISHTGSESVDIKEGTTGGAVLDNTFDGTGMTGADSWVDVKGNEWLIEGNTGRNSPLDGFQTHELADGWGTRNIFRDNIIATPLSGQAIHLAPPLDNVIACGNKNADGSAIAATAGC